MIDPTQLANAQDGLDKAGNIAAGKGLTGKLTGMFMGKNFQNQMGSAVAAGQAAIDMAAKQNALMATGVDATAMVEDVADTGKMMNYDPILKLTLAVTPAQGEAFTITAETWVSKIMIPRKGDKVNIKYDPSDTTNIMFMGIVPAAAV